MLGGHPLVIEAAEAPMLNEPAQAIREIAEQARHVLLRYWLAKETGFRE